MRAQLRDIVNVDFGQPLAVRLFFENTDATPHHLRHLPVVLDKIERPAGSLIGIFTVTLDTGDVYCKIFPVSGLDQVGPKLSDRFRAIDRLPPGGIKTASLVYCAGNAFPFKLLYAADHSLFAASIAALILSWAHAIGAVNSTTRMAEDIACFIFMALPLFTV